jgi:uncharacterized RDD family membrane protein YckC
MQSNENPYAAPASELERGRGERRHYGPASSAQRFGNYVIDTIFATVLVGVFVYARAIMAPEVEVGLQQRQWPSYLFNMAVCLLYYIPLEALTGRTLGKIVTSTQVVSARGGKPSLGQIVLRSLGRCIPLDALTYLIGSGSGLHDGISKTVVVRLEPSKFQRAMEEA